MLVARHVDTVDALLVIGQFLPFEHALAPFSRLQVLARRDIESEAVGQSCLEMALVVFPSVSPAPPVAARPLQRVELSGIDAQGVADRAVVVLAHLLLAGLRLALGDGLLAVADTHVGHDPHGRMVAGQLHDHIAVLLVAP